MAQFNRLNAYVASKNKQCRRVTVEHQNRHLLAVFHYFHPANSYAKRSAGGVPGCYADFDGTQFKGVNAYVDGALIGLFTSSRFLLPPPAAGALSRLIISLCLTCGSVCVI